LDFSGYWLKGGYPDALQSTGADQWIRWQENYVRTFVERDVARHGLKASTIQIRRLMGMLAGLQGELLNASETGLRRIQSCALDVPNQNFSLLASRCKKLFLTAKPALII
jgi:predicted AAA+ superfamily ATPase